jgi:hypothetical protein
VVVIVRMVVVIVRIAYVACNVWVTSVARVATEVRVAWDATLIEMTYVTYVGRKYLVISRYRT